jgi:hypothetical protein
MKIDLVYIYPMNALADWEGYACQFIATYHDFFPGYSHNVVVICNGGRVTNAEASLFSSMPNIMFFHHDNSGQDIGGFRAYAKKSSADYLMMLGACAHFRRPDWLKRLVGVATKHGAGLYGTLVNNEVRPHVRTTGFFCPPALINHYDLPTNSKAEQYAFEHGPNCLTNLALSLNLPTMLVTWDGERGPKDWHNAPNSFRSGDQSNCLTFDKHTDIYENSHHGNKT